MVLQLSLRNKLFIIFTTAGILIIGAISIPAYFFTRNALLERTGAQLISLRSARQSQLEHFFDERRKNLEFMVHSIEKLFPVGQSTAPWPAVQSMLIQDKDTFQLLYFSEKQVLYQLHLNFQSWKWNVFVPVPEIFLRETPNIPVGQIYYLSSYFASDQTGSASQWIVYRIPSENEERRFLILAVSARSIDRLLKGENGYKGLGLTGETYAVGPDQKLRSASRFGNRFQSDETIQTASVDSALAGREGLMVTTDYRGEKVLSAYGGLRFGNLLWAVIAEMDWAEAVEPVHRFLTYLLGMGVVLLFFIMITSYLLARRLTQPVIRLNRAFGQLEQGVFRDYLSFHSRDEFGTLIESFNRMAEKLNAQTKDLIASEQRLRHFYDATPDGILFYQHQQIRLINGALCQLTGFSELELIGQPLTLIFPEPLPFTDEAVFFETRVRRSDGSCFPAEIRNHTIEQNGSAQQVIVIHDLSRRKEIEEALRKERVLRISAVIDGQEEERRRIARELHDSLGQYLIAIRLRLENARNAPPEQNHKILSDTISLCDKTVDETRRISDDLMPAVLYELGFIVALQNLCAHLSQPETLQIHCRMNIPSPPQDERTQIYLFRIAQEALVNVVRHSRASFAVLSLLSVGEEVILRILDNGSGFDNRLLKKNRNLGLHNIRTRVNLLNGKFNIQSFLNHGTIVDVRIPNPRKTT